jgi:hypothetical protein
MLYVRLHNHHYQTLRAEPSFKGLAEEFGVRKFGVNDFIHVFEKCDKLYCPLPECITNYAIAELVYGHALGSNNRGSEYE